MFKLQVGEFNRKLISIVNIAMV